MMKERIIPELYIEQALLNELPENQREALLRDPGMKKRMEKIKISNEEILKAYPPSFIAEKIKLRYYEEKAYKKKKSRKSYFMLIIPVAAVIIFCTVFLSPLKSLLFPQEFDTVALSEKQNEETTRVKLNSAYITIYRKVGDNTEKLTNQQRVKENDILQITYTTADMPYGMIFSIDGWGNITLHYPERLTGSIDLKEGIGIKLPFSYQLDNAPDFERFFFITSETEFSPEEVYEKAVMLTKNINACKNEELNLPDNFYQMSILLNKEGE